MKSCIYCGTEFSDERPYDHCAADDCVLIWKHGRRANMAIALMPKQGFAVIYKKDAASLPVTTRR